MQEILFKANTPLLCGIVNVTPDSFSDGGKWDTTEKAVEHALSLVADGADMLDIGGESTRPGATLVTAQEEISRVVPVVKALRQKVTIPISVDTWKAEVAEAAINAGCDIINDITGLIGDAKMPDVIAKSGCAVVAMANTILFRPSHPETKKFSHFYMKGDSKSFLPRLESLGLEKLPITDALIEYLKLSLSIAESAGIARDKIFLDPGFGFGLTNEENISVLKTIENFKALDLPLFVGVSRKRFVSNLLHKSNADLADKDVSSAIVASTIMKKIAILRVHSIREHKIAKEVLEGISKVV